MRRRSGFTLIELLVVIAIIAILAAILFPVFAKAREKARQASCCSNVRQFQTAMHSYAQDYDETIPIMGAYMSGGWGWYRVDQTWEVLVQPYVKNTQIFMCPSALRNMTYGGQTVHPYGIAATCYGSCYGGGTVCTWSSNLAIIRRPAEIVYAADGWAYYGDCCPAYWGLCAWKIAWPNYNGCSVRCTTSGQVAANTRHNEGSNVGWMDGHAKWFQAKTIGTNQWHTDHIQNWRN